MQPIGSNGRMVAVVAAVVLAFVGCSPGPGGDAGDTGESDGSDADTGPTAFHDSCTTVVEPGESPEETTQALERAFVRTEEGSVVCMVDGVYKVKRQLNLTNDNITLRGESQSDTVLDFEPQKEGANGILVQADRNFAALDFTIKNTASDALKTKGTDGVVMKNITATWDGGPSEDNAAYALYPVEAKNVLIEGSKISYCRDAGVYLGQSDTAIIRDNEAFGNVVGIEVENTFRAEVYDNYTHDNTDGILVVNLPNLPVKGGARNLIRDNRVIGNNQSNFGEPGTAVSNMPQGSGIVVLAVNDTEIRNNEIRDNESIGIGVLSYALIEQGGSGDPDYDPDPEGNWIHDNTLVSNGTDPKGNAQIAVGGDGTAPQIFWDGRYDDSKDNADGSLTNCFGSNTDDSGSAVQPEILEGTTNCPEMRSESNFCEIDCSGSQVDGVDLPDRVWEMAGYDPSTQP